MINQGRGKENNKICKKENNNKSTPGERGRKIERERVRERREEQMETNGVRGK